MTKVCTFPWVAALLAVGACTAPMSAVRTHGEVQTGKHPVVLLSSGGNRISQAVTESFVRNIESPTAEFLIGDDTTLADLEDAIRLIKPAAVVALGGRAIAFSDARLGDMPLIVGLVVRNQFEQLKTPNLVGVALETSVPTEFSLYKAVMPGLTNVLTFYNPEHSTAAVQQASVDLQQLGIKLEALPVKSAAQLLEAYSAHSHKNQAVWLLSDPSLLNAQTFRKLKERSLRDRQALLCSSLREYAVAGAMMAVDVDFGNVGAQLAEMADNIAKGTAANGAGLRSPIGGKLIVNLETAALVGVDVPTRVRPFVSELLEAAAP